MSAKYTCNLPFDFLGMTGKFHTTWGEFGGYNHPNSLRYECAAMLAYGAKCSVGDQLHPNGTLAPSTYEIIGEAYREHKTSHARDFLGALVRDLFPNPIVEVHGTHLVDGSLMTKADDVFVHLVVASGPHAQLDVPTHDEIVPIHDVQVQIRLDKKPATVTQQPAGKKLPFIWRKGVCSLRIPKIGLHEIIQIIPA
jgi:hypothetical protein